MCDEIKSTIELNIISLFIFGKFKNLLNKRKLKNFREATHQQKY